MATYDNTHPSLYTKDNKNNIPKWMEPLSNVKSKEKKLDIQFNKKSLFQDNRINKREDIIATPRNLNNNLSKSAMIFNSKIELSKFLLGKYYDVKSNINGDICNLNVVINGVQANFNFPFKQINGKMKNQQTFTINEVEYPFSQQGINDSINDLKHNKIKKVKKTIASQKSYIISKEDIIRRYDGHLRTATNKIESLINDGLIVGVSSNQFATFYDPNELFPLKEIKSIKENHELKHIANKDNVISHEYKTANKLSLSTVNYFKNKFDDFNIINSKRNNNFLTINAQVLKNNIKHNANFTFNIMNEKIANINNVEYNNHKYSMNDFLIKINNVNNLVNNYSNKNLEKLSNMHLYTNSELVNKLSEFVDKDNIQGFINAWKSLHKIQQIDNNTYSSPYTFEELLNTINAQTQNKNEILSKKKYFGDNQDFRKINQKDTNSKNINTISDNNIKSLYKINKILSQNFNNFNIIDFKYPLVKIQFVNNGVRHILNLQEHNNKLYANINNKHVLLKNVISSFKSNKLLNAYLKDNNKDILSNNIMLTKQNIMRKLSSITNDSEQIFNDWNNKYLTHIGNNLYTAPYTFEELLNMTNANILTESEKNNLLLLKKSFIKPFNKIHIVDNENRILINNDNEKTSLYKVNNYLSNEFKNYILSNFNFNNNIVDCNIDLFDEDTGLSKQLNCIFKLNNGKIISSNIKIDNKLIPLNQVKKLFIINDSLSKYLNLTGNKKYNAPMIITKNDLFRKINNISNDVNINSLINNWLHIGNIKQLSKDVFASNLSFEQLINNANIKPLTDEEINARLKKDNKITSSYINDNDTRNAKPHYNNEQIILHIKSEIGSMFKDFDILDANINDDNYNVIAKIINPLSNTKQSLIFNFNTNNGQILGKLNYISNGDKKVKPNNILSLLQSKDKIINNYISLNKVGYYKNKNIITNSDLKLQLNKIGNINYNNIVNHLLTKNIISSMNTFSYFSKYSLGEIIQYLNDNNLIKENKYENKNTIINSKHDKITDTRILQSKEKKLSPLMQKTSNKLNDLINIALSNKKITSNKHNELCNCLLKAKQESDIEHVWRELNKYIGD